MKQHTFLVITSGRSMSTTWTERERYVKAFYTDLEEKVDNFKVLYTTYDDITCAIQDSQVTLVDARHGLELQQADLVHFKNWMFDSEYAAMITAYLEHHRILFFNTEVNAGLAWGKISQMLRLAQAGVPVPQTYFAKKPKLLELLKSDQLPVGLDYPLILKADDGAKGNDNHLIKSAAEAIKILQAAPPEKEFIIQAFLPNDGDYRFLFIGLDQPPLIFHRQGAADSHLNNTSQGGQGTLIKASDLPADYLPIAHKAAEILKREISGVDIIVDKRTQKPYVLEVNSTPAIATGFGVDLKADKFAEFLADILDAKEEE